MLSLFHSLPVRDVYELAILIDANYIEMVRFFCIAIQRTAVTNISGIMGQVDQVRETPTT